MTYQYLQKLDIAAIRSQPKNMNYLQLNEFRFVLHRIPNTTYFCQDVYFPGLSMPEIIQPSPFATQIKRTSGRIEYEQLKLNFMVSEDMANWKELRSWINILSPERDFSKNVPEEERFSDGTLILMNSKSKAFISVTFFRCYPISLGGIQFSTKVTDVVPATCELILNFTGYEVRDIG